MKLFKLTILFFTLIFVASCGQQKSYITYKVKEGETMRDIAKRLNVETKYLLRLNPDVGRRPNVNTTIIIPNKKKKGDSNDDKNIENKKDSIAGAEAGLKEQKKPEMIEKTVTEYQTHKVTAQENLYRLSKLYETTVDSIKALNPELINNTISIGQIIKVKAVNKTILVPVEEKALIKDADDFVTHTVQPKETVFSLSRFYGISEDDFYTLNPEVRESGLKIGQIIKIKGLKTSRTTNVYDDFINFDSISTIRLAVLLPFNAKKFDTIKAEDIFDKNPLTNVASEFYLGMELAIDSIKKRGVDVDVTVLDTEKELSKINYILNNITLDNKDAIIGPFFSDEAELLSKNTDIPIIFPLYSKNQKNFTSKNIFKTKPEKEEYINFLVDYLTEEYDNENIFIVGDGNPDSNIIMAKLVSGLRKNSSIKNINILKPKGGYIKKNRFTNFMKPKSHNWIILTSVDAVLTADALNSMLVLPAQTTAEIFAVEKHQGYDKIDNSKLARVGFTYVSDTFIDESLYSVQHFNSVYEKRNHSSPSGYATQGFDITYDVLIRLASGKKLDDTFKIGTSNRFQSLFDYDNNSLGAKNNKGLFLVKYEPDLKLKRIK